VNSAAVFCYSGEKRNKSFPSANEVSSLDQAIDYENNVFKRYGVHISSFFWAFVLSLLLLSPVYFLKGGTENIVSGILWLLSLAYLLFLQYADTKSKAVILTCVGLVGMLLAVKSLSSPFYVLVVLIMNLTFSLLYFRYNRLDESIQQSSILGWFYMNLSFLILLMGVSPATYLPIGSNG